MKVLKVLRGLLLKKSPKQGLGQSPKVLTNPKKSAIIEENRRKESTVKPAFPELIGNESLRRLLGDDIRAGRLSHAYIFEGPRGSGKHTLARLTAAALACEKRDTDGVPLPCGVCPACRKILEGKSPDVICVNRGEKATFGVEPIRALHADVRIAPNELDTKLYILEDAQLLTPQAQNAFLLTLEEPPPYVLFLLLTENALALLETVRSRAPVRRMELLTAEQIAEALTERFPEAGALKRSSPEEFRELIAAAGGCIGPAIELLDAKKRAPVLADRAQVRRFLSLAETGRNGTDAIALLGSLGQKRDELTSRMNLCLVALRDLLLLKKTETAPLCFFAEREEALALSCRFPTQGLLRLCGAVDTAIDRLRANGNVRLILTLLGTESGLLPL